MAEVAGVGAARVVVAAGVEVLVVVLEVEQEPAALALGPAVQEPVVRARVAPGQAARAQVRRVVRVLEPRARPVLLVRVRPVPPVRERRAQPAVQVLERRVRPEVRLVHPA